MKSLLFVAAAAVAAGCATTENTQVAQADCKIAPFTTASIAGGKPRRVDPLDQRWAEMQLASSDYRFRELQRRGAFNNNIEEALRDCDRRSGG